MEIANQEMEMLTTINYNDGCKETIKIHQHCVPVHRCNNVKFRNTDGTIDKYRSYEKANNKYMREYDEYDNEYAYREIETSTTNNYNNGCKKTIRMKTADTGNWNKPLYIYKEVEFKNPDGTIDENITYNEESFFDKYREIETPITIRMKTDDTGNGKKPLHICKKVEFRYIDGTINKYRSYNFSAPLN